MEGLQLLFLLRIGDDDDFGSKKCGRAEEVKEEILNHALLNTSINGTYLDQRISIVLYDDGGTSGWDVAGVCFPNQKSVFFERVGLDAYGLPYSSAIPRFAGSDLHQQVLT
jgi:hypothetical protein